MTFFSKKITRSILLTSLFLSAVFMLKAQEAKDSVHISLSKAIEIGLSESPSIRIANRDIQIKQQYKKEQIVSLFPDVSLNGSYQYTILKQSMAMSMGGQDMTIKVGKDHNYSAGASLSLPLIVPSLWSSLKLSQMDIELAMESARSSKLDLVNQIKQAYYTYLVAQQAYDVLRQSYANSQASNELVNKQYQQGLVSSFEKLRSDVALQNLRPDVTSAAKAASLAYMRLKIILGLDINEAVAFDGHLDDYETEVLNASIPSLRDINLDENSSLKQLDMGIQQLQQSKKIIKGSSCPSLALTGSLMYNGMGDTGGQFNNFPYSVIGLGLSVPIVSWAGTSYKLKQADLNIENMQDQRVDIERNLRLGAQSYLNDMQQAIENLASDKETMLQAEEAYNIAKKQYEVGMNTWLDLNTAELMVTSTRLTYCQSLFNYLTAKAALDALMGRQ
ncbi:MAG: TolC family protein [Bacteroidales bacterium]|nr:TolC family protein [Bacteroidales bacterium]